MSMPIKLFVFTLLCCLFSQSVFAKNILLPHSAEYELKMSKNSTGSPLANVYGTMKYTIDDTCDGWSVFQKFHLFYAYNDDKIGEEKKTFTNWEAKNGEGFEFTSKGVLDGVIGEILRGKANKTKKKNGKVVFSLPDNISFPIKDKTVFPNDYILNVLESAQNGKTFYNNVLFDGTDIKGFVEVNSIIGKKINVKDMAEFKNNKNIDKNSLGTYAWKIRLAFFPLKDKSSTPAHEMDMVLHDNGVVSSTTVEYKSFSVHETLKKIKTNSNGDC